MILLLLINIFCNFKLIENEKFQNNFLKDVEGQYICFLTNFIDNLHTLLIVNC